MKAAVIFLLIISVSFCEATGLLLPWSAQNAALENSILLTESVANFSVNPAIFNAGTEVSYSRLFGMQELPRYQTAAAMNYKRLNLGIALSDLDHSYYNEFCSLINLSYPLKMVNAGINYKYYHTSIKGNGNRSASSADLGLMSHYGYFSYALSFLNFISTGSQDIDLPVYYLMETACCIEDQIKISLKIEKEESQDYHPTLATSFQLYSAIDLLASYSENPELTGLGISIDYNNWQVSYGVQIHPQLDISHYITLRYAKLYSCSDSAEH